MRRLVKHGIAVGGAAAITVVSGVMFLGGPSQAQVTMAVPAPAPSATSTASVPPTEAPPVSRASSTATPRVREIGLAGERTGTQPVPVAKVQAVVAQAASRDQALTKQTRTIAGQQAKLKKAADAAEAERQEALANQGYQPGVTDPREMAQQILANKYKMGDDQFACFNNIIMRESMWDVHAENRSSGAYGIPQALPGTKMASIAGDWRENPATQITWGIEYMNKRYGSPCAAWGFKGSHGWY